MLLLIECSVHTWNNLPVPSFGITWKNKKDFLNLIESFRREVIVKITMVYDEPDKESAAPIGELLLFLGWGELRILGGNRTLACQTWGTHKLRYLALLCRSLSFRERIYCFVKVTTVDFTKNFRLQVLCILFSTAGYWQKVDVLRFNLSISFSVKVDSGELFYDFRQLDELLNQNGVGPCAVVI